MRSILESEYTIWAALIGSTFTTLATHGTDQDMVQRMLTAKNHHRSRLSLILSGFADLPLVMAFLFVGILLWAFYQQPGRMLRLPITSSTSFHLVCAECSLQASSPPQWVRSAPR